MEDYTKLLKRILSDNDGIRPDRTGVNTFSVFGAQLQFSLLDTFPLLTLKKINTQAVIGELMWMIKGHTNIKYLVDNGVKIWNDWAREDGSLGPVYGKQWRRWGAPGGIEIDQLKEAIQNIKVNPYSRRHIVNAWNVGELDAMALPPCPVMFQFYVSSCGKFLSCQVYQRSADCFLGLPFDIATYGILTNIVAHLTGLKANKLIMSIGDAHIYTNHIDKVKLMLERKPKKQPKLHINTTLTNIDSYEISDIWFENYEFHPFIKGDIAV